MVGENLKAKTMNLMDKRSDLEIEMNIIIQRLCQPGGPGLSGSLVDPEGFPRSDIDIPAVRADRMRLAELRSDYKDITQKIDQNIQLLHSARLSPKPQAAKESGDSNNQGTFGVSHGTSASPNDLNSTSTVIAMDVDVTVSRPFAMVDEITEESPAAEDGLQLGDLIVKFGKVEFGDNVLPRLASEGQANQGRPVPVVLVRQGNQINLTVTPRAWEGRGLLGCHFRIL